MEVPVIRSSEGDADCPWSAREAELLALTLELLQEHGHDRLTLDAVATTARASKATLYRRWPTKADLAMAAFIEGTRQVALDPDTGTLRGDLLRLGKSICAHVSTHAGTIRAVLVEVSRSPELDAMMHEQFRRSSATRTRASFHCSSLSSSPDHLPFWRRHHLLTRHKSMVPRAASTHLPRERRRNACMPEIVALP
jgi:AcrR family transcriptional regulator